MTVSATLADQIRAIPLDVHSLVVAERLGCKRHYVSVIRCRLKKPELYRRFNNAAAKLWAKRYPDKANEKNRRTYHRNKVLGGPGEWSPNLARELQRRLKRGESFGAIAKAMGFSRSTIAGRVFRLKQAGRI